MARDFDFRRRVTPTTLPPHANRQVADSLPQPTLKARKRTSWPLLLVVIGLGLASVGLYIWYNNSTATKTPLTASSPTSATVEPTPSDGGSSNVFTNNTETLVVQIYDSGAGETTVMSVAKRLEAAHYTIKTLGPSQFQYDKTYIWYTKEFTEQAHAIGALLTDRTISYKESQINGVFSVLVYLGKQ